MYIVNVQRKYQGSRMDEVLISQPEAAAILGLSTDGVNYIAATRRQLTRHRRGGRMFYALAEVEALRLRRLGQPKAGRPSGMDLLQRRLNRSLRDIAQPDEGSDFPPSDGLPPERHFTTPDKGSA